MKRVKTTKKYEIYELSKREIESSQVGYNYRFVVFPKNKNKKLKFTNDICSQIWESNTLEEAQEFALEKKVLTPTEKLEHIFKKYINLYSLDFEWINDDYWDCSILFPIKMLDELGINYTLDGDCFQTTNHNNNENLYFYNADDMAWFWAIVMKPFKRNRKTVGSFWIAGYDSGRLHLAYPKIARALKKYLRPLLDKKVQELDITEE